MKDTEVDNVRQINLSQNKIVILDDEDFERQSSFHWWYRGERNAHQGYAIRHAKEGMKSKTVYLHREIMNPPPGHEVIFKNFDRLDCRRQNLAVVTKEEARRHHRVRRDSRSGIKGVRLNPDGGSWSAQIYPNGFCYNVGTYYSEDEAIQGYEEALRRENPDLANAPELVQRRVEVQDGQNPDARQPSGQA